MAGQPSQKTFITRTGEFVKGIPKWVESSSAAFLTPMEAFMKTLDTRIESGAASLLDTSSKPSELPGKIWGNGMFVFFIVLIVFCFCFAAWYKVKYGSYTSTADSVNQLLTIRRQTLGSITSSPSNKTSVCLSLKNKTVPYSQISANETPLVNWRPLTVRLAGYLGGVNGQTDGVFDMNFGISNSLFLGARSFIFDIDYLDEYPCAPVLLYQDASGIKRSLNTGSIKDGMTALSKYAFGGDTSNYDPVIIVLYLRRVPSGKKQKKTFYTSLANSLTPLSSDHLGSTEQGNFHNCMSERHLFTSEIMNFQKKFIVLSNHKSTDLPTVENPKDNLDFWTNARLYIDPMGKSNNLSSIVPSIDAASVAYATIGDASQLLLLSTSQQQAYSEATNVYKIAITPLEKLDTLTLPKVSTLLNVLGVNSIPLDVLRLGTTSCHSSSIVNPVPANLRLEDLSNGTSTKSNTTDPLSFWSYAGWSRKLMTEGFENYKAKPISGFVIPTAAVPKKPSPSTNSNGGLVSIA